MTGPIRAATRRATMTVRMSVERRNCFGLRPAAVYRRIHHKQGMTSARISGQRVSNVNRMTRRAVLETEMELEEWGIPLLSQEGWREAPGWFHREPPLAGLLRNHAALLTQEGNTRSPELVSSQRDSSMIGEPFQSQKNDRQKQKIEPRFATEVSRREFALAVPAQCAVIDAGVPPAHEIHSNILAHAVLGGHIQTGNRSFEYRAIQVTVRNHRLPIRSVDLRTDDGDFHGADGAPQRQTVAPKPRKRIVDKQGKAFMNREVR